MQTLIQANLADTTATAIDVDDLIDDSGIYNPFGASTGATETDSSTARQTGNPGSLANAGLGEVYVVLDTSTLKFSVNGKGASGKVYTNDLTAQ